MAGKTTHFVSAFEGCLVDVQGHRDHFTRRLFLGLIVRRGIQTTGVEDVTEIAFHSQ